MQHVVEQFPVSDPLLGIAALDMAIVVVNFCIVMRSWAVRRNMGAVILLLRDDLFEVG